MMKLYQGLAEKEKKVLDLLVIPQNRAVSRSATRKGNEGTALNERPQGYQSEAQPRTNQGALRKQTAKNRSPS